MLITFRTLFKGSLRDRISLFWALIFPIVFLVVLGSIFPTPAYRQQLLTGMLGLSVLFFGLTGIAFESLFQRNSGVHKLLRATPYRTPAFVTNLTAARGVVALLSSVVVTVVGVLAFRIHVDIVGMLLVLPILVLGTLCFTFLGLTISNLSQNINQVSIFNNIVLLPMMFGSETFYSLGAAPEWMRTLSHLLPLSYLLDALRSALAGDAAGTIGPSLILLAFTALALALAVITFRWDPDVPLIRRKPRVHTALL
jgi:ABC-2 type transport system permease protein